MRHEGGKMGQKSRETKGLGWLLLLLGEGCSFLRLMGATLSVGLVTH